MMGLQRNFPAAAERNHLLLLLLVITITDLPSPPRESFRAMRMVADGEMRHVGTDGDEGG